jgi:3-deoxy-D-manno-octulosonic-acid transferase
MRPFWEFLYDILVIPFLWLVFNTLGLFNPKIKRAIEGRKYLFEELARRVATLPTGTRVWFHASSMGEFEQAKPIIAALKHRYPEIIIIASFFSPSGYEHSKKYPLADVITYVPFDTGKNARRFLDLIRPDIAVMVRYDVWPHLIWELHRRQVPTLLANATMRRRTNRLLPIAKSFHRNVYNAIDDILTVAESDMEAFRKFRLTHPSITVVGDTRYDQVCIRSTEAKKRHLVPPSITAGKKVIVVGSSWPEDEEVVIPAILRIQASMDNVLLILVPHEPSIEHLEDLERDLEGRASSIRFSALNEYNGERVIIVDSVGILLILYASAHIAYVGGSFRQGIHNVLEAAVYGIPVLFGPRHRNSHEPLMLVDAGGAFVVNDSQELHRTLENLLVDELARTTTGKRAEDFVQSHVGATDRFLEHLERYLHAGSDHAETNAQ